MLVGRSSRVSLSTWSPSRPSARLSATRSPWSLTLATSQPLLSPGQQSRRHRPDRAHAWTYSPLLGPTVIGSAGDGAVAGRFTTAADWRGSKAAPWQGQTSKLLAGSKPTVQPAWVQTAS